MDRVWLFLIFFLTVFSVFSLMQWRLLRAYKRWVMRAFDAPHRSAWLRGGLSALIVLNATFLLRFLLSEVGSYSHPLSQIFVIYPSGIFFAIVVLGFLIISAGDILRGVRFLIWKMILLVRGRRESPSSQTTDSRPELYDPGRRRFLKLGGVTAMSSLGAVPILSAVVTARDYQINRIPLAFRNLPPELNGFTIAQVSDLHSGVFMTEADMREIFELTNSLGAQMITITGDFVDNSDSQIAPLFNAIDMLRAEYGIYGCLGNHDHYATAARVTAAMEQRNIVMVNNDSRSLAIDGARLSIAGIDDAGRGTRNFARLPETMSSLHPESLKILLSHRPDIFPDARKAGVDLVLSGHTHGGQVGIEFMGINLNPVYLIHRYARGLYEEEGQYVYVNVGVGMVGVPIRLVKPEISLFTLTSAT